MRHYGEAHADLKALGLDLTLEGASSAQTSMYTKGQQLKGKVTNALLNQVLIFSCLNKHHVQDMLKQLNEECPPD